MWTNKPSEVQQMLEEWAKAIGVDLNGEIPGPEPVYVTIMTPRISWLKPHLTHIKWIDKIFYKMKKRRVTSFTMSTDMGDGNPVRSCTFTWEK